MAEVFSNSNNYTWTVTPRINIRNLTRGWWFDIKILQYTSQVEEGSRYSKCLPGHALLPIEKVIQACLSS